jgi:FdhD protein
MDGRRSGQTRTKVQVVEAGTSSFRNDLVATEEPLEIRLTVDGLQRSVTVTMRTPGADFELAVGFLFSEGIITNRNEIERVAYCVDRVADEEQHYNVVTVVTRGDLEAGTLRFNRNFGITSSCGICGKESLEQIERRGILAIDAGFSVHHTTLCELPERLRAAQGIFAKTGGLHAAALFDRDGGLIKVQEDVGRHNAVDKLIGWALLEGRLPLSDSIMMVSGRSSFEIAQKCAAAGIPVLCAVSAPSSLAVDLAKRFNLTLVGFLRDDHFNIYHGANRIELD